jgi:hypothetical protein
MLLVDAAAAAAEHAAASRFNTHKHTNMYVSFAPMNGAASATNDASPTPTSMRQKMSDLKPTARPQPNVAMAQVPIPMPISRKALRKAKIDTASGQRE